MRQSVDDLILAQWRKLDAVVVLERLGCYTKADPTFRPLHARSTTRFHVSAEGIDFELLLDGPRFFDARARRGGGGAIDLAMHLFDIDFKNAVRRLKRVL